MLLELLHLNSLLCIAIGRCHWRLLLNRLNEACLDFFGQLAWWFARNFKMEFRLNFAAQGVFLSKGWHDLHYRSAFRKL